MTQPTESDAGLPLVEALIRGEPQALTELLRQNERWVRGVILGVTGRPDLASDVAQEVWTTVWQQIGTLRDPSKWRSWLYQLTRRSAIDASKQRGRRASREVQSDEADIRPSGKLASPEEKLIAEERHRQVMQAIQSLPALYREPFVLKHLEGWTYAEIGDVLGLPVDTVETRLVRARRLLRDMLQGKP
ncbi:MAG: RNA polymerase sigma factor [Phycisphaerae bacterium]|nr:RNA polymerase sigma factor [Phycisphaerae bacterium]